ncbi:MAG: flagellin [Massilia sp.]
MLSLHTNFVSLSAQKALSRTQTLLSAAMTRLSTGYRINASMDDAAGLQIATRLKAQNSGMAVAMRNTQNSISMLQTADGALNEVNGILTRMKDLATQAADGASSDADKDALQSEYDALTDELSNVFSHTSFGGTTLLNTSATTGGRLGDAAGLTFQIGADSSETMHAGFAAELAHIDSLVQTVASSHVAALDANGETQVTLVSRFAGDGSAIGPTPGHALANAVFPAMIRVPDGNGGTMIVPGTWTIMANPSWAIHNLGDTIDAVSTLRSKLGAVSNRLDHVYNNLANIAGNTQAATGRIMDVDFATESSTMTANQMLMQAGTAMLKQTGSMASMVMSLLQ